MQKRVSDKTKHLNPKDVFAFKNYVPGTDVVFHNYEFVSFEFFKFCFR